MADLPHPLAAFIVGEIRRARGAAGMTQEAFGRGAGFSASHVSAVEGETRALTMDFIKGADRAFKNGGLFERMVGKLGAPSWFLPWLDAERTATQLRSFQPNLVPGLLQTEAYGRAVIRCNETLSEDEVEKRLAHRIDRQAILTKTNAPQFVTVIAESVLRRASADFQDTMAGQIKQLTTLAERPNISVHVLPDEVSMHVGLTGPFSLARLPDHKWVAEMENQLGGVVVDRDDDVDTLVSRWEMVRSEALPRRQSLVLMKEVETSWT
ncbi:helix-turn-helix domain-containing protein [Micromonospora parathelypteridis]|uniref:Transcriptional regulator with XRE-family HTH domain n=1 Tax=Micromonospora parathelypteridis TaxID=1839617 RepID=A0A840VPE6_9ACTN|nr:helix-turn-helix transcriptional regulator [Micromonospora parathelypteridis]MBB5475914.1 transcriptional regulator with XRE-family HTH domain [Micromonospora parathelypteridis]GGO31999.1 transcriptional regulator [Micromonospora parathelypteridis]